ncbi:hypothetical protein SAMN05444422_101296 [Halobiforma haloterrestris]|uniref:Uncharacterized protein n=1 Tax=Natronobacterium haloterrestre TaxID=148448 RepID=A0A1I1DAX3_NATHA|nr:hypothetical protein SAMN05444422_101296 [Halobiforma haloterrestris]
MARLCGRNARGGERTLGSERWLDIEATVAVFGNETSLPKETQEYTANEWSANGAYTDVDSVGFVSDGITAMASNPEWTSTEPKSRASTTSRRPSSGEGNKRKYRNFRKGEAIVYYSRRITGPL